MPKCLLLIIVALPCLLAQPETGRPGRGVIFIQNWEFEIGYSAEISNLHSSSINCYYSSCCRENSTIHGSRQRHSPTFRNLQSALLNY
jgi:hypothetical protein